MWPKIQHSPYVLISKNVKIAIQQANASRNKNTRYGKYYNMGQSLALTT
jgi:hypothetical protein